jgi:hypothetical protein
MIDQVTFIMQQYPWLQHLVAVMVICRIIFKPLFQILGKYVELTVEEDDNKKLHKIMASKSYKMASFIVDMLASVKLPQVKGKK